MSDKRANHKINQAVEAVLVWSETHRGATLRELEEQVQEAIGKVRQELMEAAVERQGRGELKSERCACGGRWVFQGYRRRQVMTTQGAIVVERAYYTCDRCGAGIFPPG